MHQDYNGRWVADSGEEEDQVRVMNADLDANAAKPAPLQPTAEQKAHAAEQSRANSQDAHWDPVKGEYYYTAMSASDATSNELARSNATPTPTNPNDTEAILNSLDPNARGGSSGYTFFAPPPPPAPPAPSEVDRVRAGFTREPFAAPPTVPAARPLAVGAPAPRTSFLDVPNPTAAGKVLTDAFGVPGQPAAQPGDQAPDINRDKIDKILGGLTGYQNDIYALSKDNTGLSAADAQLMKADALAKIRARDELAANQAGALGAARSARNRGDRALLERQAVGEQAYLGSQAQRADTLRQAELEGNLASLRATEEEADRRFRLDALSKASELGLNTAALEVDISKANLDSANNWVNNEAKTALQKGALDEQQYEALLNFSTNNTAQLLGFTRDMAAIQFQYDQLSVQDQQAADALLVQKYGIDQQTMVALKQIKQSGKFRWDQVLTALVGGAATGGTGALAGAALGGGRTPAAPSMGGV